MVRISAVVVTIATYIVSIAVFAAPSDSLVRIERLSPGELLLFTTAPKVRFREELATSGHQVRVEILGCRPADSIREVTFPSGTAWTAAYVRQRPSGCLVILEQAQPSGYIVTELPYSHALYIRRVNWDNAADCALAWGILAWSNQQYHRAMILWQRALSQGNPDAAYWLGIAEALQGRYAHALNYLEPAIARRDMTLPDVYAALSLGYGEKLDTARSTLYYRRFTTATGRQFLETTPVRLEENLTTSEGFSLFDIADRFSTARSISLTDSSSPASPPQDDDIFAQLRQFQQRTSDTTAAASSSPSPSGSYFLLILGVTLFLIGFMLTASYRRWRKSRIQQLAAAITPLTNSSQPSAATPPLTTFDEIMAITSINPLTITEPSTTDTEDNSSESSAEQVTIELDDLELHHSRPSSSQQIDERLFYQSDTDFQLSQQSPEHTAPELSEQERDLLRILERLSRKSTQKHDDKA